MEKLITRICWTGCGVRLFTDEVNAHIEEGWSISVLNIDKKGLRIVCYAILVDLSLTPEINEE